MPNHINHSVQYEPIGVFGIVSAMRYTMRKDYDYQLQPKNSRD